MLTVTPGERGVVANNNRIRSSGSTEEESQARKKARCEVSKSPGNKDSNARVHLRVDVNASRVASPGRVPVVRRSFEHASGDEIIDETSDAASCKYITL